MNFQQQTSNKISTLLKNKKVGFIKVNNFKLIEVELFSFFHSMCVAANASKLFCMANQAKNECFLYHSNL